MSQGEVCLSSPTAITSQSSAHPPSPSSSNPSGYTDVTFPPPATKCLLLGICPIQNYTFKDLVSISTMKNFDMALLSPSGSSPPLPVFSLPHPHVSSPHVLNNGTSLQDSGSFPQTLIPRNQSLYISTTYSMDLSWGFIFLKSFAYYCVGEGMCAMVHSRRPESNSSVLSFHLLHSAPGRGPRLSNLDSRQLH